MVNLVRDRKAVFFGTAAMAAASLVTGCGKEKEEAPAPVATSAPAPEPVVSPLEGLRMDPRVQFPQERSPSTRELAEAIAKLATALVKGDATGAQSVLNTDAAGLVDEMVTSGEWKKGTTGIEAVRVCVLTEQTDAQTATVGLGIQDSSGAYLLAWKGMGADGLWKFSPMPVDDTFATQVALLDGSAITSRTLPDPELVSVDPESRRVKVRKMFSKGSEDSSSDE